MLSAADWAAMAADLAGVRGDNPVNITIRRGATTLAAQEVRIAGAGGRASGTRVSSAGGAMTVESRARVVVLGGLRLNIRVGDRFSVGETYGGTPLLYRVALVRPNREAGIIAEAELVE